MAKIINIHTGRESREEKVYNICSLCETSFCHEDEGGITGGAIGMIPVNFCSFCLSGVLDMSKQLLGIKDE